MLRGHRVEMIPEVAKNSFHFWCYDCGKSLGSATGNRPDRKNILAEVKVHQNSVIILKEDIQNVWTN